MEKRRKFLSPHHALIVAIASLFAGGCALPHVHIVGDPLSPEEHLNLGVTYEQQQDFTHAIAEYKSAAKGDLKSRAWTYIGNVYYLQQKPDDAEKWYRRAIGADKNNAEARNNLAWVLAKNGGDLDEAEKMATRALHLDPTNAPAYQNTLMEIDRLRMAPGSRTAP